MDLWNILRDIVVLLAASLLLGGFFSRLGQSPLVGYLLGGMLLGGPGSMQLVHAEQEIEAIAELGVALLLFSLGLEFSLTRLKQLGARPLVGGVVQVIVTTLLGAMGAMLFGLEAKQAIAFGVMISLSSTAVVLRMLMERVELEMPHGRNALAVLLTQDMAVVPLALLMTLLGGRGGPVEVIADVGKLLFMAAALVVVLYVLNRLAVRGLGTLTLLRNRELTVIFAVVTGLGSAWAAHAVGISPALGAFIAGMFLGSSAFATQIRADISSVRVVLLTLFFGAAGMVADPIWIIKNGHIVAAVTALVTLGKLGIIWVIFQMLGDLTRVAAASGLCLAQIGEFAFVLGSIGRSSGVVSDELYALVVSVAIVSFILTAMLVPLAPRFGNYVASLRPGESAGPDDERPSHPAPDVVFIGFGPAGRLAAQPLMGQDRQVVVIDLNRACLHHAKQMGFYGEIGDATQIDVLEHAQLNLAKAVVITIPHARSALTILELVRQQAPQASLFVRSRYQMHTEELASSGADLVTGDEEQVGESLANHLQHWLQQREEEQDHDDGEPSAVSTD